MRVLIIEDNIKTSQYLSKGLRESHFNVDTALDGGDGLFKALNHTYDIIILDVMLPLVDGWEIIKKIRAQNIQTPILFLTARDTVDDRVKGLEFGADDYLIKPFAFSELVARMHSLLRRTTPQFSELLEIADLKIDIQKHQAIRSGMRLRLTAKEFMLLLFLVKRQGEALSRTYIAEQVWDINFDSDTNAIDVAIKRLRDKVDTGFEKKLIHNVRGVGYVLEER